MNYLKVELMKIFLIPLLACCLFGQAVPSCPAVIGNGVVDDTASLQSCFNSTADDTTIVLGFPARIRITGTVTISGKHNLAVIGTNLNQTSGFGAPFSGFVYDGPANGTAILVDGCDSCHFSSLAMFSANGYGAGIGGAGALIDVEQINNHNVTTTNITFDHLTLTGMRANPVFKGIAFALNSGQNVEKMIVENSTITCSYTGGLSTAVGSGIVMGSSFNSLKHTYRDNAISGCGETQASENAIVSTTGAAIFLTQGSASVVHNELGGNGTAIFMSHPIAPVVIEDNDVETAYQFFVGTLSYGSRISNNRISNVLPKNPFPLGGGYPIGPSTCVAQFIGGSTVLFEGNGFDQNQPNLTPVCGQGAPYGAPSIITRGNAWPNFKQILEGFKSFGYGQISELEMNGGFLTRGNAYPCSPTADFGCITYVSRGGDERNHWSVSESSGSERHLMPDVGPVAPLCSYVGRVWFNTNNPQNTAEEHCLIVNGNLAWVAK